MRILQVFKVFTEERGPGSKVTAATWLRCTKPSGEVNKLHKKKTCF